MQSGRHRGLRGGRRHLGGNLKVFSRCVFDSWRVDISGGFGANDSQMDPTPAFASITFESDGDVIAGTVSGGAENQGNWINPKAIAPGAYEISMHQQSGDALDVGSAALDTWIALTDSPQWAITQTGVGVKVATLTASIRLGSDTLSSGVVSLQASVT
jgi:hypothetical protein